ncbi:2OG-Fe(II) oxygenase family oxidoreductase [Paraphoma chrysanthemicola]|uniref:2OG-Fe(II) oxygenase family oxidoreductase n=1 Tax=Paraphoma chrysanthemicola TaxID=798071 RepID=A0A8K0QSR1_9PLEO|nr:2OG-Fe(II) oxygenase family oxidoreductase [Paraphoma chrysanthemicola]
MLQRPEIFKMNNQSTNVSQQLLADLPIVHIEKIRQNDREELEIMLQAGRKYGFFYVDLRHESCQAFLADRQHTLQFMEGYFSCSVEDKMKDYRDSDTHGYKPVGTTAGSLSDRRDNFENLKISYNDMSAKTSSLPATVLEEYDLLSRFQKFCHEACLAILSGLSSALDLHGDDCLTLKHRHNQPTPSTLALFRYPQQEKQPDNIGHKKHTDMGTLTFLLCEQWGLQLLLPDTNTWHWIEPHPGHAIVNVGDGLRFMSGNRLLSAVHRVLPRNGQYQDSHRYSIVYFLRPEYDVTYCNAAGESFTAEEWQLRKFSAFRRMNKQLEDDSFLCGGMEYQGTWTGNVNS